MKFFGWICTILGALSLLGALSGGSSPIGPLFWLGLGIFLLFRSSSKEVDKLSEVDNTSDDIDISEDINSSDEPECEISSNSLGGSLYEDTHNDNSLETSSVSANDYRETISDEVSTISEDDPSESVYNLVLEFADAKVSVHSMHISQTYEGYLEGRLDVINADIIDEEQKKIARAGDGHFLVPPIYYGKESHSIVGPHAMLGDWRFEINIEHWVKSSPDMEYLDQLYTLTLVLFSNKISDDQIPLWQHLSQYTRTLNFFDLAHKCVDEVGEAPSLGLYMPGLSPNY